MTPKLECSRSKSLIGLRRWVSSMGPILYYSISAPSIVTVLTNQGAVMRALAKFAIKVLLAICVFICSRAVLAVAHALGWFPEQQLANLLLAAPTALQIEVVMWGIVAFVMVGSLLLVDYFVHRRNYRKTWDKVCAKLAGLVRRRPVRKMPKRINRPIMLDYRDIGAPNHAPPQVIDAPGLVWRKVRCMIAGKYCRKWSAEWRPPRFAVMMGYPHKSARVWMGTEPGDFPDEFDCAAIRDLTNTMQAHMEIWLKGYVGDGTRWIVCRFPQHSAAVPRQ
jgi:hypothetical protein